MGVRVNRDGSIEMTRPGEEEQLDAPPPERDRRRREPVPEDEGF
jgi:penicillin-binding protein 1A